MRKPITITSLPVNRIEWDDDLPHVSATNLHVGQTVCVDAYGYYRAARVSGFDGRKVIVELTTQGAVDEAIRAANARVRMGEIAQASRDEWATDYLRTTILVKPRTHVYDGP